MNDRAFLYMGPFYRIQRWIDWFIPGPLHEAPLTLFRSRVLVFGSLLLGLISSGLLLQYYLFFGSMPRGVLPASIISAVLWLLPFLVRWTSSYKLPGFLLTLTSVVGLPGICYKQPLFITPVYFFFPLIPLVAVFFVNTSIGVVSSLFASGAVYWLYLNRSGAVGYPPRLVTNFAVYLCVVIWMAWLFAWLFERSRIWSMAMLEETTDALRDANHAKDAFLARVSHELRTPLNAIIGYSEMIEEEAADIGAVVIEEDAQRVLRSGQHLLSLIDGLLDLTQLEEGVLSLSCKEIALDGFIESLCAAVAPLAEKRGDQLSCVNETNVTVFFADEKRLFQVLLNILTNACKFTENGQVTLSVRTQEGDVGTQLLFEVRDTGIGIEEEQREHIFELFTQADASFTRKVDGLGLGLPLARRLCRWMGGDITVESTPGEGTCFVVRVPLDGRNI